MDRFTFLGRKLPPAFERRVVAVLPRVELPYDPVEWHGAIVVVERGEVDLLAVDGGVRRFTAGDVLSLAGLPLRALRNPGAAVAVMTSVRRRGDEFPRRGRSSSARTSNQEPTP